MIPTILELLTLKRHQADDGRLFRARRHIVRIEREGDVAGCLLGRRAFALCGGVRAAFRLGGHVQDLVGC